MKKWLISRKRLLVFFLIFEFYVLLGYITGLSIILFAPAYLLTLSICCGDYPSPEILFASIQLNAFAYAICINIFINFLSKKS
ncbi:hypothetical protein A3I56_04865 [Candidatus Roizmanbacteria bacterium RIFCSPLOWO2_02_FULL_43_10]|uniref:Uncharacterized protein n=2 Tax=Candidatus Roizmaniibacteriota TaxID=1752723 RepID=A0A1F7K188_9BACT|nr:MAG: hypothetical protein A3F32_02680 [Candidatus Roizmanbacteria bacterium RIFCSPHIGHO2_12_FULL_42_10]OGK61625.1 MAG: hypothetical protein A3I56_04865 [Candidatus Roizmanbacteria bacterium RIFCSPLOWO2_02_FULL_43_10]